MFEWLKGLKPGNLLKALGKKLLIKALKFELPKLVAKAKEELAAKGPKALDGLIDNWQAKLVGLVSKAPLLPESLKKELADSLNAKVDGAQVKLNDELLARGPVALDLLQDYLLSELETKINNL